MKRKSNLKRSIICLIIICCSIKSVINQQLDNDLKKFNLKSNQVNVKINEIESINESSSLKLNSINVNQCEEFDYDCAGCLSQENCVYCWFEQKCVIQHHFDRSDYVQKSNQKANQKTPSGILNEREASILNNNTILIKPMSTVSKDTCPKRNTLSNISASSCAVNELTLLWLMFTSVILSVIVLFGILFYCCVFKNKSNDMIIITSDKDNFVLINEE